MMSIPNFKEINVVILCGGLGTRLRSKIGDNPKVMATVGEKPFLDIILQYLRDQGLCHAILCTGYKAEEIENHYRKKNFGLTITFSRESEPLGTGGAVLNVRKWINSNPFFVLNGDSFCPLDYHRFLEFHARKKALASIAIAAVRDNKDFGTITTDSIKRIINFSEKVPGFHLVHQSTFVNAGIYCFEQKIFDLMPVKKFSLELDFFPKLVDHDFYGFEITEKFFDIGTPERYKQVKKIFK